MDKGKSSFNLLWVLPLMLSLTFCGGGGGGGASDPSPSITGSTTNGAVSGVVADKSGVPISGVTITAYHTNNNIGITTTTDVNGAYSFTTLSTGLWTDYQIYAKKPDSGFILPLAGVPAASSKPVTTVLTGPSYTFQISRQPR